MLWPQQACSSSRGFGPPETVSDMNWQVNKSRNIISSVINHSPGSCRHIPHYVGQLLSKPHRPSLKKGANFTTPEWRISEWFGANRPDGKSGRLVFSQPAVILVLKMLTARSFLHISLLLTDNSPTDHLSTVSQHLNTLRCLLTAFTRVLQ